MNVALLAIAAELTVHGVEVDLLTRATGEPREAVLLPGVTLRALKAGPAGPVEKARLSEAADAFGEEVARLAGRDETGYDIIHAHHWLSGLATLPVGIELGVPFVQSFHSLGATANALLPPRVALEGESRIRSESFLATQADAIVANSAAEVSALIDIVGAPADRVWVIPPGVDLDLFSPERAEASARIRRSLELEADRPIVSTVGSIQPMKGQDLAIRALAELHALRGWAPLLVIAGSAAPGQEEFEAELRGLAVELGVGRDVRFVGALDRDSVADLLAATSVTLVPSWAETFGLVALESAASGTPTIAARSTGLVESVADGVSGFLVDSRDAREWALEIAVLLDNPDRAEQLATMARAHAEKFTWAACAASLLGVYASLR
jgi:D-inositol-3-phosphate glycosyltransferase